MKRLMSAAVGIGVLVGLGFYVNRPKSPLISATEPVAEAVPAQEEPVTVPAEKAAPPVETPGVEKPVLRPVAVPSNPGLDASFLVRTVAVLVYPQSTYMQRWQVWLESQHA